MYIISIYIHGHICIIYVHVYILLYVYMYTYVYLYIHIHIYHTHAHMHSLIQRQNVLRIEVFRRCPCADVLCVAVFVWTIIRMCMF